MAAPDLAVNALREQILEAAKAALNDAGRPAGIPETERSRTEQFQREETDPIDALVIYPQDDPSGFVGGRRGPLKAREFRFIVECWAEENENQAADTRATAMSEWVVAALEGTNLGGLVNFLYEVGTGFDLAIGDIGICVATVTMAADYQHRTGDLTLRT